MPGFLKQSTASQSRAFGPFVDDTDFKTLKTALTIANTDIKLVVNGGASANKNSGGGTHRVNGVYGVTFDATDTATVGEMEVSVAVAGAMVVFDKFFVVEEVVYDALFGASAIGYIADQPVNVTKVNGTAQTAGDICARLPAALGANGNIKADVRDYSGTAGTFAGGRPEVNTSHIAGAAVNTTLAQVGVNVVNYGGSAGTFAGGRPEVNTARWAGTATTLSGGLPDVNTKTITNGIIAAATFAANALDAVWSTAARVLTAGTNIVLAKGVGVTGFNDIAAGTAMTLTGGERTSVADALLDRDMAAGADSGGRTVRNALRFLRNRFRIAGATLTVYKEDDASTAWTSAVTTTAGNPVSESDPA